MDKNTLVIQVTKQSEDAGADSINTMAGDFVNALRAAGYEVTAVLTTGVTEEFTA